MLRDELPHKIYSKIPVEKYLVPVSGSTVTTNLPLFSFAILLATNTFAPAEMPTNTPSLLASFLVVAIASSF